MDARKSGLLQVISLNYILINEQESEVINTGKCTLYIALDASRGQSQDCRDRVLVLTYTELSYAQVELLKISWIGPDGTWLVDCLTDLDTAAPTVSEYCFKETT